MDPKSKDTKNEGKDEEKVHEDLKESVATVEDNDQ